MKYKHMTDVSSTYHTHKISKTTSVTETKTTGILYRVIFWELLHASNIKLSIHVHENCVADSTDTEFLLAATSVATQHCINYT